MLDYVRELRNLGAGALFITHDMAAATRVADRITVMRAGAVVAGDLSGEPGDYTATLWRSQPANEFWGPR